MSNECCSSTAVRPACSTHAVSSVPVTLNVAAPGTSRSAEVHHAPSVPLTDLRPGQTATVVEIRMETGDAAMLRAMGLRVDMQVRVCRLGEPCIIELMGGRKAMPDATADCPRGAGCTCRIGLSRPLARSVRVRVG